jgi:hypothetical protein
MKLTRWHLMGSLLGGALGYGFSPPSAGPQPVRVAAHPPLPATSQPSPPPAWNAQLAAVRKAPASRSEAAWVKWAFAVPDADLAAAVAGLNPLSDFHALRVLFCRWVGLDPTAAWNAFNAIPIPKSHLSWFGDQESELLSISGSILQHNPRALIMGRMLYSWHRHDPAAALAYAQKLKVEWGGKGPSSYSPGDYQITEFIREKSLAATAPGALPALAAEVAAAASLPDSYTKQKTLQSILKKWAGQDADAAARWLLTLPEKDRAGLKLGLSADSIFSKSAPALKTEILITGLRSDGVTPEQLGHFRSIPKDRWGMISLSYNTNYQIEKSAAALEQWTSQDPAAVQAWLASQPEDELKTFLTGEMAGTLSRTSPNDAIALLKDLPDDQLPSAVGGLASGWMQKDAAACVAWVAKIDDPATRESCQQAMARSIMSSDPALALRLSLQITDETVRRVIQQNITNGLDWNPAGLEKIIAADPAVQAAVKALQEKP